MGKYLWPLWWCLGWSHRQLNFNQLSSKSLSPSSLHLRKSCLKTMVSRWTKDHLQNILSRCCVYHYILLPLFLNIVPIQIHTFQFWFIGHTCTTKCDNIYLFPSQKDFPNKRCNVFTSAQSEQTRYAPILQVSTHFLALFRCVNVFSFSALTIPICKQSK